MPRRIPGEHPIFAYKGNDCSRHLAKTDNPGLSSELSQLTTRPSKMGKFTPSKGKPFGQCTKIGYDVQYTRFSAIMKSGAHNGIVGRSVIIKVHVNQCPKKGEFLFNIVGGLSSPYNSMNRKMGRAFIKFDNFIRNKNRFYTTSTYDLNYQKLTKNKCGNHSKTIELWHKALISFNETVRLYLQDKKNHQFFFSNKRLIQEANSLVLSYFWLVSKNIREHQNTLSGERITSLNIFYKIKKLQCLFVESCASRYYAVRNAQKSYGRFSAGVDGVTFLKVEDEFLRYREEQLVGTRYKMSGKSTRVKKRLPLKAQLTEEIKKEIKSRVTQANMKLEMRLYENCDIKTYRKDYKRNTVKHISIFKPNSIENHLLGVHSLQDRVLQMIVHAAAHPIIEYQTDPHSFAFRPNMSAIDAIALLVGHLEQQDKSKTGSKWLPVKVSKKIYDCFKGLRIRKREALKKKDTGKRQKEYLYSYYVCGGNTLVKDQEVKKLPFLFFSNYHVINVAVQKCFDNISHQVALQKYPLYNRYSFFLKAWLKTLIYIPITWENKIPVKEKHKVRVTQSSIIGPSLANCVLDGLEETIRSVYKPSKATKHRRSEEEMSVILKYKKDPKKVEKNTPIRFLYLRFADDILIIGKNYPDNLSKMMDVLVKELKSKGLKIKNRDSLSFWFKPGVSFDYLGFRFIYASSKSKKLNKGKYTENIYTEPHSTLRGRTSAKDRSGLIALIRPKSFQECRHKIRGILARSNATMSLNELIKHYNTSLRDIINYFEITRTTRTQLRYLDYLGYRWFRRLLLQKFSSAPGVRGKITKLYYTKDWRVRNDKKTQIKTDDLKPLGNLPLANIRLNSDVLNSNIYLDQLELRSHKAKMTKE